MKSFNETYDELDTIYDEAFGGYGTAIDKASTTEEFTEAPLWAIEQALLKHGYKILRKTPRSLSAMLKSWTGYNSKVTVINNGSENVISDEESSKGLLCNPKADRIYKILDDAEMLMRGQIPNGYPADVLNNKE